MTKVYRDHTNQVLNGDHVVWNGMTHVVKVSYRYQSTVGREVRFHCWRLGDETIVETEVEDTTEATTCLLCIGMSETG